MFTIQNDGSAFITTKEACNFLKISYSTLIRLIKRGKLTTYTTGRKLLISKKEVEDIINNGRRG